MTRNEQTQDGIDWLKTELMTDYWSIRAKIISLLESMAILDRVSVMIHWQKDLEAAGLLTAGLLTGAVRNDHVYL